MESNSTKNNLTSRSKTKNNMNRIDSAVNIYYFCSSGGGSSEGGLFGSTGLSGCGSSVGHIYYS